MVLGTVTPNFNGRSSTHAPISVVVRVPAAGSETQEGDRLVLLRQEVQLAVVHPIHEPKPRRPRTIEAEVWPCPPAPSFELTVSPSRTRQTSALVPRPGFVLTVLGAARTL